MKKIMMGLMAVMIFCAQDTFAATSNEMKPPSRAEKTTEKYQQDKQSNKHPQRYRVKQYYKHKVNMPYAQKTSHSK